MDANLYIFRLKYLKDGSGEKYKTLCCVLVMIVLFSLLALKAVDLVTHVSNK